MRLHIGGEETKDGWTVLNVADGPAVDIKGTTTDMSAVADGSCQAVYASHVLEHLRYEDEVPQALAEMFRVLAPSGTLYISVPDLMFLCRLFALPEMTFDQRFTVMQMMYGGHDDEFDFHKTGFNDEILSSFLTDAGFTAITRVESFGLFDDSSEIEIAGHRMSLNVTATKP